MTHSMGISSEWNDQTLSPGEGQTISCRWERPPVRPESADILIVVDYRPFGLFPYTFRKYFRFRRFEGPYTSAWQWTKQPSAGLRQEVDEGIDRLTLERRFPQAKEE
jgi:hypothetical protein